MTDFIAALGLVLVIEGVLYAGLPGLARRIASEVGAAPESALRTAGLFAVGAGVFVVWLVRG